MKKKKEMNLLKYLAQRILISIPTLLGVLIITFFISRALPGDPVMRMMPPRFNQELYDRLAAKLGMDKPLYVQLLIYMKDLLIGNWGYSITIRHSRVWDIILQRFPRSLEIMFISMIFAVVIGIKLGKISASHRNKFRDVTIRITTYIGVAIPGFLVGIFLHMFFKQTKIKIFPLFGFKTPGVENPPPITHFRIIDCILAADYIMLFDYLWHLFLPLTCMIIVQVVIITRQTRASMIEILEMDYIRTARAKGCTEKLVIGKHALKNSLTPTITVVGMGFPIIFAGMIAVEVVFNLQGMGQLFYYSMTNKDYPILIALVFLFAIIVIVFNLIADVIHAIIDPRIKYR